MIRNKFPAFHLEDKVDLQEGSIVRPPPIRFVYARKRKKVKQGQNSKIGENQSRSEEFG